MTSRPSPSPPGRYGLLRRTSAELGLLEPSWVQLIYCRDFKVLRHLAGALRGTTFSEVAPLFIEREYLPPHRTLDLRIRAGRLPYPTHSR